MLKKPNIIWILCDELRADALDCYRGFYDLEVTPNIKRLADRGVRFDRCYCNSPLCVPSRTSQLTARYVEQTGVYANEGAWPGFELADAPETFPEVFAEQGYATANFGKIHYPNQFSPWQHDEQDGGEGHHIFAELGDYLKKIIRAPGVPTPVGGEFPDGVGFPAEKVTTNALAWIAQQASPYLARVSILQPHTPVTPPAPFKTLFVDSPVDGIIDERGDVSEHERRFGALFRASEMSEETIRQTRLNYLQLTAWMDSQVGRILSFCEERNELDNTIIVFTADHGASHGECGAYEKHTFAPQSQRVPLIIAWPKTLGKGEVRSDICESLDLARTLLGLCGLEAPDEFAGRNVFDDPSPEYVYSTVGQGNANSRAFPYLNIGTWNDEYGWPRRSCIRTKHYRLDCNVRLNGKPAPESEQDIFLADTINDPTEAHNLAADPAYAETVSTLLASLNDHIKDSVEPLNIPEPTDKVRRHRQVEAEKEMGKKLPI